jgi:hypothetical protein
MILTSGVFGSFFVALYIPLASNVPRLTPAIWGATIAVGGVGVLAEAIGMRAPSSSRA